MDVQGIMDGENIEVQRYLNWTSHLQVEGWRDINSPTEVWDKVVDGILLLNICEKIRSGVVDWTRVNKPATNAFKRLDNCSYLCKVCESLGIPVEGVQAKDICQGNHKTILNILWLLMRQSFIILNQAKTEEEIKQLAAQYDVLAQRVRMGADELEPYPLTIIMYYGEDGEVFMTFEDESELDCDRLGTGFDRAVREAVPSSSRLGHIILPPTVTQRSQSHHPISAQIDRPSPSIPPFKINRIQPGRDRMDKMRAPIINTDFPKCTENIPINNTIRINTFSNDIRINHKRNDKKDKCDNEDIDCPGRVAQPMKVTTAARQMIADDEEDTIVVIEEGSTAMNRDDGIEAEQLILLSRVPSQPVPIHAHNPYRLHRASTEGAHPVTAVSPRPILLHPSQSSQSSSSSPLLESILVSAHPLIRAGSMDRSNTLGASSESIIPGGSSIPTPPVPTLIESEHGGDAHMLDCTPSLPSTQFASVIRGIDNMCTDRAIQNKRAFDCFKVGNRERGEIFYYQRISRGMTAPGLIRALKANNLSPAYHFDELYHNSFAMSVFLDEPKPQQELIGHMQIKMVKLAKRARHADMGSLVSSLSTCSEQSKMQQSLSSVPLQQLSLSRLDSLLLRRAKHIAESNLSLPKLRERTVIQLPDLDYIPDGSRLFKQTDKNTLLGVYRAELIERFRQGALEGEAVHRHSRKIGECLPSLLPSVQAQSFPPDRNI